MTLDELQKVLVRLRLIEPAQLDACRSKLRPGQTSSTDLLRLLEGRHLLTPYQVGKLAKGETDSLVLGDYKLLYRNASGSFARVYRAASLVDGSMVGLKVLRQRWASDPRTVRLFRREAELGRKLVHDRIVPIYEIASQGDFHYFTMEFVEGGNLRDFLNIRKQISATEALRCLIDMADALDYAARQGVTHRDLKLTNVLMSSRGEVKLVDFGLAGDVVVDMSGSGDSLQRALEYATIEKATNAPPNDPRSDLYFLGGIVYELLTGIPPYPRTHSREERKQFLRYSSIRPIRSLEPNLPKALADIVERLMRIQPEQRYQSAAMVRSDAQMLLQDLERGGKSGEIAKSNGAPAKSSLPTILCVEHRVKMQNVLRDYLSRRGFRVLLFNDVQRGIARIQTNPPDCVVLMGESIGDEIISAATQVRDLKSNGQFVDITVLADRQEELLDDLDQSDTSRVMTQPVTLRELRREIHVLFQRRRRSSRSLPTDS